MSNKTIVLLLFFFGGLLLLLIFISALSGSLFKKEGTLPSPTPILSSDSDSTQEFDEQQTTPQATENQLAPLNYELTDEEADNLIESSARLADNDKNNLLDLFKNLPFEGDGFIIESTISNGKVVGLTATIDGASGRQNLSLFLSRFGLTKILGDKNIITIIDASESTTDSTQSARLKKKKKQPAGKAKKTKDEKLLADFGKTMLSFDFTKKVEPTHTGGGSGSANCQSAQGNEKIYCEALKYDPLPYSQAQRALPSAWRRSKCPNIDPANPGCALDCSGLVGQAIYDAFGTDRYLTTATMPSQTDILREIPLGSVRTGDIVWYLGHTAIVEKYDGRLTVFEATGHREGIIHRTYGSGFSSYTKGFRYIGPGGTP